MDRANGIKAEGPRWEERQLGSDGPQLLITPDPSAQSRFLYLPPAPRLSYMTDGKPIFSLIVVLTRSPQAEETSILPLIDHSLFNASFTVALKKGTGAEESDGNEYVPLLAHAATFSLSPPGENPLATADAAGPNATATLGCTLTRYDTIRVLTAIDGQDSGLEVGVHIEFKGREIARAIHLTGKWADVYDAIADRAGANKKIAFPGLKTAVTAMLADGTLTCTPPAREDAEVFAAFMRAAPFIISKDSEGLPPLDQRNTYGLRNRPNAALPLDVTIASSVPAMYQIDISAPLNDILEPLETFNDLGRFIRLVAPSTSGGDYAEVPRLTKGGRAATSRDMNPPLNLKLALSNGGARSLSLETMADSRNVPDSRALLFSDTLVRRQQYYLANDAIIQINPPIALSLPILDDESQPYWRDRLIRTKYWYAPVFTVVPPSPSQTADTSPFLFSFTQNGVTAGPNPQPGLNGTVRFTLQKGMSPETAKQLGNSTAVAVPTDGLAVSLELPFRDEATGASRTQLFPAKIEVSGDQVVGTVELLDSWVRLCYGALAYADFQAQPCRVAVSYSFRGYITVEANPFPEVLMGGKIAQIATVQRADLVPQVVQKPVFDLSSGNLHLAAGMMRYMPEPSIASGPPAAARGFRIGASSLSSPAGTATAVAFAAAAAAPAAAVPPVAAQIQNPLVIRPNLEYSPAFNSMIAEAKYITTTAVREQRVDLLFSCSTFATLYIQTGPNGSTPIGCQTALRLGETPYKQFEEIPALADASYRVYRSLQQPGRFLITPATYRITRYGPSEGPGKAYRPVILLYGVLNADPTKNRYFFRASLQPDIPYGTWRQLQEKLIPYAPSEYVPQLELPTDPAVQASTSYVWHVPQGLDQPEIDELWDGFQFSVSANLENALLFRTLIETTGISGSVQFKCPDGLTINSQLNIDTVVAGPWSGGPITVSLGSGVATISNNIEQPLNVTDLVAESAGAASQRLAVNAQVPAHGEIQTPLTVAASEAYAMYLPPPGGLTLEELDVFSEDIVTHVIFANQITYGNHSLTSLQVQVRLINTTHVVTSELTEGQSASVDITLPLATYLESQKIQFQVTKTFSSGPATTTGWLDWDLTANGNILSLTWNMIQ
uniref:Uncharacterized protein n=1 Tax=Solibacter usitatus (strain Ellin6076) TaxID=234267 RepID=Q01P86_SOLUE